MKLTKRNKKKSDYTLLAFLAPMCAMFVMMLLCGFKPFGDTSMLYSDMYHQYYPFFVAFRKALRSGDSLLYTWSVGMGVDYLGLISYYLASPLNLLSVFVPEKYLLDYFSLLPPIKLGFAGLFFAIFLKKTFHRNDFSIVLFGGLYALCAWALGYQWNVMWLDTFAVLPLVALGTVRLLRDRKFVLYTLSLFFCVFANYYIGLFICIFVALVFVCYEICRFRSVKRTLGDLGTIALFSALAIGMTAILTLPAYAALQTTYSSVNTFPKGFVLNIAKENNWKGLLDAMRQVAGNMNSCLEPTFKEGLPNLYCGISTNILAILFLTCKQVRIRDRISCVVLLVFFNISFIIRQLDYIWHGFHFTNMIPYRFSFLHSFVMLYMAYRAWLLRNRFRFWQVGIAAVGGLLIILCSNQRNDMLFLVYNCVFLLLYTLALIYPTFHRITANTKNRRAAIKDRKDRRSICSGILLGVIVIEMAVNLMNFSIHFTGTTVSDYPRGTESTASMIRYMNEREEGNLFFRAEATHSQTLNDGALNGYNGISTFTSSANVKVTEYMKDLGYAAKNNYNRYCYEESSPVSNLFLNLKYMIERQDRVEENYVFDHVHQYGKVHLLENAAYLPLGFMTDNQILNVDFQTSRSTFLLQNDLFRGATGLDQDVWSMVPGKDLSISATGVELTSQSPQTGHCSYFTTADKAGTLVYKYIAPQSGLMCVDMNLSQVDKFSFWKDGAELYSETYSIPQSLSVCQVEKGDIIELHMTCNANTRDSILIRAAILNEDVFWDGYDILSASTLELTTFRNTRIEGRVSCARSGILYTSIPQDGNWTARVDGKEAETVEIGGAMVGLLLPEGEHTVTFRYRNKAFALGWKVTLVCTLAFVGIYLYVYRPKFIVKLFKKKNTRA